MPHFLLGLSLGRKFSTMPIGQIAAREIIFLGPLASVVAAFTVLGSSQSSLAFDSDMPGQEAQSIEPRLNAACPLIPRSALKSIPATFEVYQYDSSPLAGRTPLLLIHGLLGEYHAFFRWQELSKYLSLDQAFNRRYKIYLARYNSKLSLGELTKLFDQALCHMPQSDRLMILTVSLSGEIVRDAMKDPAVDQSISRVITMGAFFRGSPLFCQDWMKETIRKRHVSPLTRFYRSEGYKLYFDRHKNLLRDYRWDDADGQMPTVGLSSGGTNLELSSPILPQKKLEESERQPSDQKFVVYAGYLHNQYTPYPHGAMHVLLFSPVTFFWTTLPAHLGREHPMLRFINNFIAETVPRKDEHCVSIYPLNDGISPVTSGLLLTNDFVEHSPPCSQDSVSNIRTHSNAGKARLFDNVDHLTFIERRRPLGSAQNVTDVLSLNEKPRPMFAWILKDLME